MIDLKKCSFFLRKVPCIAPIYRFIRARIRNIRWDMVPWLEFEVVRILRQTGLYKGNSVMQELHNIYLNQNRRMFIVATGPSIRMSDLDWLWERNELSISVNTIYKVFGQTKWRPTYYYIQDYNAVTNAINDGIKLEDCGVSKCIVTRQAGRRISYKYNKKKIGILECNFLDHWSRGVNSKKWGYSSDLLNYGLIDCCTVVNGAIALADFMGIKDIYLLGLDGCLNGKQDHVGEGDLPDENYQSAINNILGTNKSYYIMRSMLKNQNLNVYNATRGGVVEAFKRVNMDDIIAGK